MPRTQSAAQAKARAILGGAGVAPPELFALVAALKAERGFGLARKILERHAEDARLRGDPGLRLKLAQTRALCTYKDPDLPAQDKLERALAILGQGEDLATTRNPETLGLAGAIHKRRWELTGRERELELALGYYHRGHAEGEGEDYGYNGINAAFVLDVLAELETAAGTRPAPVPDTAGERRARARAIRGALLERLGALAEAPGGAALRSEWWFLATLGEAAFGLGEHAQARAWLREAKALPGVPDWEIESTARQLATLMLLRQDAGANDAAEARATLSEFLGNDNAVVSVLRGRIGLALSGGGFRASLYHIGVLAKLAELDLLRSVEYLSCVSGGSIIGAHYYLEVRKLLQERADAEITREDYIALVRRIETDFLRGVERNIRTRILAEWRTDLKMILLPDYSRTLRAGELYESEIFSRIDDGGGGAPRWLNELKVAPRGERADFRPKDHNWQRANKVPILILNATTLNTGHNWRFTATWMGEPPGALDAGIDANYRLRRLYYEDAPNGNERVRLGHAVAASACVPGLFEPLSITRLYRRRAAGRDLEPIVRLVDGGVHDNQGTSALLEQSCNVLLVSDASGQMSSEDFPGKGLLAVPLRSNGILQARVREAQYRELAARRRSGLLKGLLFVHLKQGLEIDPVDWIECQDPSPRRTPRPLTDYGVLREVQERIAAIRTDLDSFSEAEAGALMCSGYLMTERALAAGEPAPRLGFELPPAARADWRFLELEPLMGLPDTHGAPNPLLAQLAASDKRFFKIWSLSPALKAAGALAAAALVLLFAWLVVCSWSLELFALSVGELLLAAGGLALSLAGLGWAAKALDYRKALDEVLIGLGLVTLGSLLANLHLHVFDRLFLRQGRLDRLRR